jgi:hypothetical protein
VLFFFVRVYCVKVKPCKIVSLASAVAFYIAFILQSKFIAKEPLLFSFSEECEAVLHVYFCRALVCKGRRATNPLQNYALAAGHGNSQWMYFARLKPCKIYF